MKRLLVVFVILMMLFVVGCQSVSIVNADVIDNGDSIFFMSDENSINAGITRDENSKHDEYGVGAEDAAGIINDTGDDTVSPMVRLTDETLVNADDTSAEDNHDERTDSVSRDGQDGKNNMEDNAHSLQPNNDIALSENDDALILMIPTTGMQPASQETYSSQETTSEVLSDTEINPDEKDAPSGKQPASQDEIGSQETNSEAPSDTEITPDEKDDSSDTQPASQDEIGSQETTSETPSDTEINPGEKDDSSDTQSSSQEEDSCQVTDSDDQSNNEPYFKIQIDSETDTLVSYEGTASYVNLENEHFSIIGNNVFKGNEHIESVKLPNTVTEIGESAFEGCINLTTLQMPTSIRSIGDCAFKGAVKLSGSLDLYNVSIYIGKNAFEKTNIESIVLKNPKGIELTVDSCAFADCSALTSIKLEDMRSSLDLADNAFYRVGHLNFYIKNSGYRKIYSSIYTLEKLGTTVEPSFPTP